ncbi:inorganic triphosphatase [Aeromonas taiwanensis]|uniref:CYTH domain-containing protein n=1 Tax=Aeromonas taiwanensis TaxID=633417 RepID=UPI0039892316
MQTEIEIKFFVTSDIQDSLSNFLNSLEIISSDQARLGNVYFDTPALDLRRLDMGLRIRRSDHFSEQTIKCRGQVVGGLHARPEYNAPIDGSLPTLSAFPAEIWPSPVVRDEIQSRLVAQFSTDFLRRHWLVAFDGALIELAWDRGEIVGALGRTEIDELELEIKSGEPAALFGLAEQLAALGGLRLGAQSKAQRGYRLAGLGKPLAVQPLPEASEGKAGITAGLQHWQHHEQLWLEGDDAVRAPALQGMLQGCALVAGAAAALSPAPAWLPELLVQQRLLAEAAGEAASLQTRLHDANLVGLQLAIAAWLHLNA